MHPIGGASGMVPGGRRPQEQIMKQVRSINEYVETGFYVVLGLVALAGIIRFVVLGTGLA